MQLIIRDEFVVLVGNPGKVGQKNEQWLLRIDSSGAVVQRRAPLPVGALASFVGADLNDPIEADYFNRVVAAWQNVRTLAEVLELLEREV